MKYARRRGLAGGFTLIEMVVTLALVGLLAMMAMPSLELAAKRAKEAELRAALRTLRGGLDAYKAAVDAGLLVREAGESGYPKNLDVLTQSLELAGRRDLSESLASKRMVILRQLPRDPFSTDLQAPAATTWNTRAYASRAEDPQPGDDVFDVSSKSDNLGLDGTPYSSW